MTPKPIAVGANVTAAFLNDLTGVIDRNVTETDVVSTAAETSIYSKTIPAGTLGTTRLLELDVFGDYLNNSGAARNLTMRVKLGATTIATTTLPNLDASAGRRPWRLSLMLGNRSVSVQRAHGWLRLMNAVGAINIYANGDLTGSATEDTATALTLDITVQHSTSSASLSCRKELARLRLD